LTSKTAGRAPADANRALPSAFPTQDNHLVTTTPPSVVPRAAGAPLPPLATVEGLARELLAAEGTRLQHVRTAALVASRLSVLFDAAYAELLVTAALLHDIGYSTRIAHTGFHPLDGAAFLQGQGYPQRLAELVAHHSLAILTAPAHGIGDLEERFPRETGLLADALAYADMHSSPDGTLIDPERRFAGIARRHPEREHGTRADQLRASIARVETALRAAAATHASPRRTIVLSDSEDPARARRRRAGSSAFAAMGRGGDPALPAADGVLRGAFDAWWTSESRYTLALDLFQPGIEDHAAALRLARLRSRADQRRDRYFRAALQ
jgi:HD superfamily phosphodiesterase